MAKDSSSGATIVDFPGLQHRMDPEAAAWLTDARKISQATWEKFPVASGTVFFPEIERKSPAVFFQAEDGGWKARAYPDKAFTQKKGTEQGFWNLSAVLAGPMDRVYITEGEIDTLSLAEAGIGPNRILSAPSGTTGLAYVEKALAAGLAKCKRFIWCGDQDPVGLALRAEMAKVLGIARFYFIEWPDGIKDANDFLRKDGREDLNDLVRHGAIEWPAEGIFRLSAIADMPPLTRWLTGFDGWAGKVYLAPGTLSVVTGQPGMGKTQLWSQIWFQVAHAHDIVIAAASFETRPKPHYQRILQQLHGRGLIQNLDGRAIAAANKWIDDHYLFLLHPERRPTLEWTLDQAEIAVVRYGAKVVKIDPWNRMEPNREGKESETEYASRCLRALYNFAVDFGVHIQVVAHPAKANEYRRLAVPTLEDIAGSKHWDNMVDQGFVVHRPRLFDDDGNRVTYSEMHHVKARFDELGYPSKFGLEFDVDQGRFGVCPLAKKKQKSPKEEAQQAKTSDFDQDFDDRMRGFEP